MAANIQVVLREDVNKLGKTGSVVKVKPGFARNFLIPRGLAVVATEGNLSAIEHEQKAAIARAAKLRTSAEAVASKLSSVSLEIQKPVGDGGKLYGSVTTKEIVDALKVKGVEVDKKKVVFPDTIKTLGDYEIIVKLTSEVRATIRLAVTAKS